MGGDDIPAQLFRGEGVDEFWASLRPRHRESQTAQRRLGLQEGTGQAGGKRWAGIPSGVATHLPLASASQWLSWQGPSYLSIHLWGLRQKFNSAGN